MDLLSSDISGFWAWLTLIVYCLVVLLAAKGAKWRHLADSADSNIFLAVCAALVLTWALRASVHPGLHLHFLGGGLLALMFGWHFAVLGGVLVVLGALLWGHGDWLTFGANGLLMNVLPVSVVYAVFLLAEWKLPKNFFVYIFVSAFVGGALSMVFMALVSSWFLQVAGGYSWELLQRGYFQFNLLMAFPEGFTTGFLMSVFVVYRPEWVYTFRDDQYLKGK